MLCSVDKCDSTAVTRGLCNKHYLRWWKYGDTSTTLKAEDGALQEFIEIAVSHQDNKECLFWPYARNHNGYAVVTRNGLSHRVSRIVCENINGPPPSSTHQAAHNCGKGHLGCVNPHHLEWKTPKGNSADRIIHGTNYGGEQHGMSKLTEKQTQEIRSMKGKLSQRKVATIYGVNQSTIHHIWNGKTWKETHKDVLNIT